MAIYNYNYSKCNFKCLLTKDPSETSSLEHIIKKNYCLLLPKF